MSELTAAQQNCSIWYESFFHTCIPAASEAAEASCTASSSSTTRPPSPNFRVASIFGRFQKQTHYYCSMVVAVEETIGKRKQKSFSLSKTTSTLYWRYLSNLWSLYLDLTNSYWFSSSILVLVAWLLPEKIEQLFFDISRSQLNLSVHSRFYTKGYQ